MTSQARELTLLAVGRPEHTSSTFLQMTVHILANVRFLRICRAQAHPATTPRF